MTGLAGGFSCLTESAVSAKRSGIERPAVVSAPSERKSRREVMANRVQGAGCSVQGSFAMQQKLTHRTIGLRKRSANLRGFGRGADASEHVPLTVAYWRDGRCECPAPGQYRSEEHTSELQS